MYPSIKEYKEAILFAEDNFEQIKNLRPVLDEDGNPVMSSGNFAVVFKMKDEQAGRLYAVKCFLRDQDGRTEAYRMISEELEYVSSTFLTSIKYLDKELFVDTDQSDETEFPVLLMDWVEGMTLDKYIREHIDDQYELSLLAYQFSRLAMWLMPQPFAHGDLKPDNILVKDDGTLVLVDYDGMYVPAMKGLRARELGSPDFRHPSRTETDFDEHIDDFSLASILLSLKAISLQPSLLEEYGASDRLLFSEKDYRNLSESKVMDALKALMQDAEQASLYSLFILAISQNNLSQVSFRLFNLKRPKEPEPINIDPYVTDNDLYYARIDEYGVEYSKDWKRLLHAPADLSDYIIKSGTKVICSHAFDGCKELKTLKVPNGVTIIGTSAFENCENLTSISIPRIKEIPSGVFGNCISLHSLVIPDSVTYIGIGAFYGCVKLESIFLPNSITTIEQGAFENCSNLKSVSIPQGVERIEDSVFSGCSALKTISLPLSVKSIGNEAFCKCNSLTSFIFPENIEILSANSFARCCNLYSIVLPKSLTFIGENAFEGCSKLRRIEIPNRVKEINDSTFQECGKLQSISFGNSIIKIGKHAFEGCWSLTSVSLPDSLKIIDDYAFHRCKINTITMPDSLEMIGNHAFENGIEVNYLNLPYNLKEIGDYAFAWCSNLVTIEIPQSVMSIGESAFTGFSLPKVICINSTSISIAQSAFEDFEHTHNVCYIGIPIGYRKQFEEQLPDYINKFVELDVSEKTFVTEEDLANAWTDEYGVKYSADRKKLLEAPKDLVDYSIAEGTLIICEHAFSWNEHLKRVTIPDSVITIGDYSFSMCRHLSKINLPLSVLYIGQKSFWWTYLRQVIIPDSVVEIGDEAFSYCCSLTHINIPASVTKIGRNTFYESNNLEEIGVPVGLLDKFAKMLPNDKYKLREE